MFTRTTPKFGPIGADVYNRTYSRNGETWHDTVDRVVSGNAVLDRYTDEAERRKMTELMDDFRLLPAGRHLWVTGVPGIPGEARRNCWRAPFTSRLADHFEFLGSMLLLGGGVGANYSAEYLAQAPAIRPITLTVTCDRTHPDYVAVKAAAGTHFVEDWHGTITVEDSREGWVSAWGHLFDAATGYGTVQSPAFDVSKVRAAGEPILTFGGTASGPGPLVSSLVGIYRVLRGAVGRHFTGLDAMDCDHEMASAVVAGGARRSARMSIMHWDDPQILDFIACKSDPMKHWTTNISVEVDDQFFAALEANDVHAVSVMRSVIKGMHDNGEPGFYNVSASSVGETGDVRCTNPCGEIPLEQGESCNIGSVDLAKFGTDDDGAEEAFRQMARFLVRQTLTSMTTEISAEVEDRNRRIGVGFLGFQGWCAAHGVPYSLAPYNEELRRKLIRFRMAIRQEANSYADELGISRPIKVTAIAPNGTISQLGGTQAGAHPVLARWYIRNVRFTSGDPRIADAQARGLTVEPCIYAENTWVVSYPVADTLVQDYPADLIEQIDEIPVYDQLAVLAMITETFCGGDDGNAVSFTASFDPANVSYSELWTAVETWLPRVKGITTFPTMSRPQSPYIPLTEVEYLAMTGGETVEADSTGVDDLQACAGGACPIR